MEELKRDFRELLQTTNARIALLEKKLAQNGVPNHGTLSGAPNLSICQQTGSPPPQPAEIGTGDPEGSRSNPVDLCGSDIEEDHVSLDSPSAERKPTALLTKNKVDLGVIELSDSESEIAPVRGHDGAVSDTRRRSKRRRTESLLHSAKDSPRPTVVTEALSEASPRKHRKTKHPANSRVDVALKVEQNVEYQEPKEGDISLKQELDRHEPHVEPSGDSKPNRHRKSEGEAVGPVSQMHTASALSMDIKDKLFVAQELDQHAPLMYLRNPKAEIKEELLLSDEHVLQLLAPSSLAPHPVTLPEPALSTTVTRAQLSRRFGGNTMDTFPRRAAARNGGRPDLHFMCLNLLWNPHAPQRPGHGGLFFEISLWPGDAWTAHLNHARTQTLFVRLTENRWLYLGEYEMVRATPLSVEHWAGLNQAVRNVWVREIMRRSWGKPVRARIQLRRTLGREATRDEVDNAQGAFKNVTEEDIMAALDAGEESIQAWSMQCVGYDEDFQEELVKLSKS